MGRPNKQVIDYFPHANNEAANMLHVALTKYGASGYALYFILYEQICANQGYYIKIEDEDDRFLLSALLKISEKELTEILWFYLKRGIFDREKYTKYKILTSKKIQLQYIDIKYANRASFLTIKAKYIIEDILPMCKDQNKALRLSEDNAYYTFDNGQNIAETLAQRQNIPSTEAKQATPSPAPAKKEAKPPKPITIKQAEKMFTAAFKANSAELFKTTKEEMELYTSNFIQYEKTIDQSKKWPNKTDLYKHFANWLPKHLVAQTNNLQAKTNNQKFMNPKNEGASPSPYAKLTRT